MASSLNYDRVGWPAPYMTQSVSYVTQALSSSTLKLYWVVESGTTSAITTLGFRYSLRTGTPPTYKISLQSVDATTGKPTGTILGGGSPASATFTPPATTAWDGTWQWITLTNSYTPATVDEIFAIVIEYSSGTVDGSNNGTFTWRGLADDAADYNFPYSGTATGGTYTNANRPQMVWGFKTASASFGWPQHGVNVTSYSSTSTPDAYGVVFNIPANQAWSTFTLGGVLWIGHGSDTSARTITLRILDLSGGGAGSLLTSETVDCDIVGNTGTGVWRVLLSSPQTLTCGTKYAALLEAGGTSMNLSLAVINTASAGDAAAYPGGANFWLGTTTDSGSVTEDTTQRPIMGLYISAVTPPTGGGLNQYAIE